MPCKMSFASVNIAIYKLGLIPTFSDDEKEKEKEKRRKRKEKKKKREEEEKRRRRKEKNKKREEEEKEKRRRSSSKESVVKGNTENEQNRGEKKVLVQTPIYFRWNVPLPECSLT